jgi:glycosyltransferase involved in cell wall biosynthesis
MVKKSKVIRIGFIVNASSNWLGGFNYIKNLLFAIKQHSDNIITPIIFIPKNFDEKYKIQLLEFSEVFSVSVLNKKSLPWYFWKVLKKITNSDFALEIFLFKYKIEIFSHSSLTRLYKAKTLNWIADFQHLILPKMFNELEVVQRNKNIYNIISYSDLVLFSSKSALYDYRNFFSENNRIRILEFVSQPGKFQEFDEIGFKKIKIKYNITGEYFIVPNQLWKHKNHMVVINALDLLNKKGIRVKVVFTGLLNDYRNVTYADVIKKTINDYNLDISLLGLIDYEDVIILIKGSISVINPSLFEGWSTIVEECKSLGKNIILSRIPVHVEQAPAFSTYFNPDDYVELANIIQSQFNNYNSVKHLYNKNEFNNNLNDRTKQFYLNYSKLIEELV